MNCGPAEDRIPWYFYLDRRRWTKRNTPSGFLKRRVRRDCKIESNSRPNDGGNKYVHFDAFGATFIFKTPFATFGLHTFYSKTSRKRSISSKSKERRRPSVSVIEIVGRIFGRCRAVIVFRLFSENGAVSSRPIRHGNTDEPRDDTLFFSHSGARAAYFDSRIFFAIAAKMSTSSYEVISGRVFDTISNTFVAHIFV